MLKRRIKADGPARMYVSYVYDTYIHTHILSGASELSYTFLKPRLLLSVSDRFGRSTKTRRHLLLDKLFGTLHPCYLFNWVHSSVSVSSLTIWIHHAIYTQDCIPTTPQEYGITVGHWIWGGGYLNYLLLLCNEQNWGIKISDVMLHIFKGVGYQFKHIDVSPSICKGMIIGSSGLVVLSLLKEKMDQAEALIFLSDSRYLYTSDLIWRHS